MKPSVLLIYTGGTIGMIKNPETGVLTPFNFDNIISEMPVLKRFGYNIESYQFNPVIDSSNANGEFWKRLAILIKDNYEKFDGFVILHGTDTMAYTASALSFMLEDLYKPVILTGSQLPIGTLRTDGKENLITAIEIAASKTNNSATVPEVCIFFESKLLRGNRTTKHNAEHFDAFKSYNYPPLAEAGVHIKYNTGAIHYAEHKKLLKVYDSMCAEIGLLKMFPNIGKRFIESIMNSGIKGLVLETFGTGNAITEKWFIDLLERAMNNGMIILNITQCRAGRVEMGRYETSLQLFETGVISGFDMTTEAAVTKMMFLYGQELKREEIIMYLNTSIAGEVTIS